MLSFKLNELFCLYLKNKLDSKTAWKKIQAILLKRKAITLEPSKADELSWMKTQSLIVNEYLQVC